MKNWQEFGNPDGKQPMEVSIALPTFLLEKEHHNTILIIYLIAMVVIIPCEREQHPAGIPLTIVDSTGASISLSLPADRRVLHEMRQLSSSAVPTVQIRTTMPCYEIQYYQTRIMSARTTTTGNTAGGFSYPSNLYVLPSRAG